MKGNLKEHNIPVYEKLEQMMDEKNKALVVTATGTGKSYLTLEYITRHNLNTLVVVPRISIGHEWDKMSKRISTITYHSFVRTHNFDKYDCVVFDEVHHAGATTWESPITHFIETTEKKVIGLTADPKRYSDGARDMGKVLFEDCRVDGYNLTDAMEKSILPKLTYVAALWDVGTIREQYARRDIPSPLMARFNYALDKRKPIEEIIAERMPEGDRKGIIFVETISATIKAEELIRSVYPKVKVWIIHSKQSTNLNEKYHNAFKKAKSGFMIAVDMYNEGLHAPGVNTIIMLRRTSSPTIFYQQIGRALHVGDAKDPIIFDCVSNNELIKVKSTQRNRLRGASLVTIVPEISDQTFVYDYTKDILDVIKEIDFELDNSWSDEELAILAEYYPLEGLEVYKRLPGRNKAAIMQKAHRLRIASDVLKTWTEEEDNILKEYYESEGGKVYKRLEDRNASACKARAEKLGLKYDYGAWTDEELAIVKKYYETEGYKVLERLPGRTKQGLALKAGKLGLRFKASDWTSEEIDILRKYYPKEGIKVMDRLPGRSKLGVKNRAQLLGIKYENSQVWTDEEIEILKQYYPIEGYKVLERLPGRTKSAIQRQLFIHKIKKKGDTNK